MTPLAWIRKNLFATPLDAAVTLARPDVRQQLQEPSARAVVLALAEDLAAAPRLGDREAFRAAAARVRERTHQKGRALFHPIRLALTGRGDGPELDLAAPAIDAATALPPAAGLGPVVGCRERAEAVAHGLQGS